MLKSLYLENYRCFEKSQFDFKNISVIVGKNNAGKSTMIEALRMVAYAARKSVQTVYKEAPYGFNLSAREKGIRIDVDKLKIDLRGIVYLYENRIAKVEAVFDDGSQIIILANQNQAFARLYSSDGKNVKLKSKAMEYKFDSIGILPQIGLIKENEKLLERDTVENNKETYLSSRHFRNEILLYKDEVWDYFKTVSEGTWENLRIEDISYNFVESEFIRMMVKESNFVAEIGLMGSGLQMWLQIIWFLSRSMGKQTIILDEPDVYMHPDLQQKLIKIVTKYFPQVIIATHSIEIISEVSPANIIMLDKNSRQMKYANNLRAVQSLIDNIGGIQNLSLIRIGLKKKCLFVEGNDLKILSKFYDRLFPDNLNSLNSIPTIQLNGFSNLREAYGASKLFYYETEGTVKCIGILDRDYYDEEYLEELKSEARTNYLDLYIWKKKEIENYLIKPRVIYRIIGHQKVDYDIFLEELESIIDGVKDDTIDQISEKKHKYYPQLSESTCNKKAREYVNAHWGDIQSKIDIIGGKKVLKYIKNFIKSKYNVSLTEDKIIKAMGAEDIDIEVAEIINKLM